MTYAFILDKNAAASSEATLDKKKSSGFRTNWNVIDRNRRLSLVPSWSSKWVQTYHRSLRCRLKSQCWENHPLQLTLAKAKHIYKWGGGSLWHHSSHFLRWRNVVQLWHNWRYLGIHPAAIIVWKLAVATHCVLTKPRWMCWILHLKSQPPGGKRAMERSLHTAPY